MTRSRPPKVLRVPKAPEVGEIVIFYANASSEVDLHNGTKIHPGIITRVWSATCVNLKVFFDGGPVKDRGSVQRLPLDTELHDMRGYYWEYPNQLSLESKNYD